MNIQRHSSVTAQTSSAVLFFCGSFELIYWALDRSVLGLWWLDRHRKDFGVVEVQAEFVTAWRKLVE